MQDSNLNELVKVAREGDLASFDKIVHLFERRIYGYIFRHLNNREDAEDLTQEVFLKLYKKFDTYDPTQSFSTWLFTIATHTVYDHLRKIRGKQDLHIIDDLENSFETPDDSRAYIEVEASVDVGRALDKIKPTYRTVLLLFYRDDLTCEEIARILQKPVGTIKTHLSRARAALKEVL